LVVGQLGLGGLEKQVFLLARGLDRGRYDVTVISLSKGGAWAGRLVADGLRVEQIERHGRLDWRRLLRLERLFRSVRPDLVYSFNYETNAYARLAGLAAGVPILITGVRGTYLSSWYRWLEARLIGFTECVVCNADVLRRDLIDRVGLPAEKVIVIHNGAEVPPLPGPAERAAARRAAGLAGKDCLVGTVARLTRVKDLGMLIRAADICRRSRPGIRFCIVGGGPEETALREEVRRRGLEGVVVMTGEQPAAVDLLAGFDVFVLTSTSEGLPNTVMEAMAAGLPCVCTNVGGCPELVVQGVTGHLVPAGDETVLVAKILDLAGDPATRARMGRAGRDVIETRFSIQGLVSGTERLFDRLIAARDLAVRGRRLAVDLAKS
jgi:glycosyltransferase involved in cell wall biosynthesis